MTRIKINEKDGADTVFIIEYTTLTLQYVSLSVCSTSFFYGLKFLVPNLSGP